MIKVHNTSFVGSKRSNGPQAMAVTIPNDMSHQAKAQAHLIDTASSTPP